ncbi:hypothetical protein MPER_15503, partial [Moniliophthora perniciosa FA553]
IPPGVILFLGLQFVLPDSPRWLIRHGYDDRARLAYTKITGQAENKEFDDMREQILYEKDSEVTSIREAWAKYRKRVAVAVFVQTMTSLTGVNVISDWVHGQYGL